MTPIIQHFGTLADGSPAMLITLRNPSGMTVALTTYGAAVVALHVPDRRGNLQDVALGYDSLDGYVHDRSYLGVIVGRYANRIAGARFALDGAEHRLTANDGRNHLHGGVRGFHKKLWRCEPSGSSPAVRLTVTSRSGEEGYPGNVTLHVTYTLTDDNALAIDYEGSTDAPTILNPTHHSYFNLSGHPERTILGHRLQIASDFYTPSDAEQIPTGAIVSVSDTPMDFRSPAAIGTRIGEKNEQLLFGHGYDHNWVLRQFDGSLRSVATLAEPESGRLMTVFTDQPGLQFYSGNNLDGTLRGKHDVIYGRRTGLCLEAQRFPDSPNKPQFPSAALQPGHIYRQRTVYRFSVMEQGE